MAIDKLKIFPERDPTDPIKTEEDGSITVAFNPTNYSIIKSLSWTASGGSRSPRRLPMVNTTTP